LHPEPLAEPDVNLSAHPAPIKQTRSPCGFRRLGFSLHIGATDSCSSTRQPASASRPLYAGRRPLSHQASSGLVPGEPNAPGFDDTLVFNDASSKGSLSFVSRTLTCTSLLPRFSSNAHHHGSLPQRLGGGLRPAPESRSRGAFPHLSRSLTYPHG
jgi:hypothetical protein